MFYFYLIMRLEINNSLNKIEDLFITDPQKDIILK